MIERLVIDDSSAPSRAALLADFLAEVWGRPYQLGQWDCILFIAAWADRVAAASCCRPNPLPSLTAALHGQYTTEADAIRQLAPNGINAAILANLVHQGWREIVPVTGFLPGDIILTDLAHPGIWDGEAVVAQPARSRGRLFIHTSHASVGLRWGGSQRFL